MAKLNLSLDKLKDLSSTALAILKTKCPRCYKGDLFPESALNVKEFYKMNKVCPDCSQTFEPEPGFYFGAMFISYGLLVIMSIVTWISLYFTFKPVFEVYLVVILLLNVLLLPFIFRYSRTLYLFGVGGIVYNQNIFK